MPKYINADNLYEKLEKRYRQIVENYAEFDAQQYIMGFGEAINAIKNEPAADVQEVKHGHWTICYKSAYKWAKCYCSVCGKPNGVGGIISNQKKPYCPNCGAKMDVEKKRN